jgi:hypothetical protein
MEYELLDLKITSLTCIINHLFGLKTTIAQLRGWLAEDLTNPIFPVKLMSKTYEVVIPNRSEMMRLYYRTIVEIAKLKIWISKMHELLCPYKYLNPKTLPSELNPRKNHLL